MKKSKISCNLKSEFSRKFLEEPTNHISINMGWAFFLLALQTVNMQMNFLLQNKIFKGWSKEWL